MCRTTTHTYTCSHTHSFRLSTCRGVFPSARDKSHDGRKPFMKKQPKPQCLSGTTVTLKSSQPCGLCQHAAFEQEKTAKLSEAQAKFSVALERVVEAHELEDKGFVHEVRARREECERLREELESLEEGYLAETWAMDGGVPGRKALKGKRSVKKGERVYGGSMLRCEVRPEEVVLVGQNDGWGRGAISDESTMSASDEYESDGLALNTLAITEEERRQIDADNSAWYEAFSTTDMEASEADGETETGPPTVMEEEPWQIATGNAGWYPIAEHTDAGRANAAIAEMDECATSEDWDLNVTTPAIAAIQDVAQNRRPPVIVSRENERPALQDSDVTLEERTLTSPPSCDPARTHRSKSQPPSRSRGCEEINDLEWRNPWGYEQWIESS